VYLFHIINPILQNGVALSSTSHPSEDPPRNLPPGRVTVPPIPHISTNRILRHQRSLSKSIHHMPLSDTLSGRLRSMSISGKTAPLSIEFLIVGAGMLLSAQSLKILNVSF
jgi:hypothetical protein